MGLAIRSPTFEEQLLSADEALAILAFDLEANGVDLEKALGGQKVGMSNVEQIVLHL